MPSRGTNPFPNPCCKQVQVEQTYDGYHGVLKVPWIQFHILLQLQVCCPIRMGRVENVLCL